MFILAVPLPVLLGVMVYLWAEARRPRRKRSSRQKATRRPASAELAQGYLKSALGTMDRILDRVGDERMARIPAIQEERTAILADAVAFYETMLRLDSTDPTVRHDTAHTYKRVAHIGLLAGRTTQSVKRRETQSNCSSLWPTSFRTSPNTGTNWRMPTSSSATRRCWSGTSPRG